MMKDESFKNVRDIQDKMKSLKKHQAFEAEIMANADRIRTIKQVRCCFHVSIILFDLFLQLCQVQQLGYSTL